MALGSDTLVTLFLQDMCTFLSYKERVFNGSEASGSGPITHANERLVPKSLRGLAYTLCQTKHFSVTLQQTKAP